MADATARTASWFGQPADDAPLPNPTYLVHGAPKAARFPHERITERLRWTAVVPRPGEKVLLP